MLSAKKALLAFSVAAVIAGCATRGPVDRSVDAVHATNRTIGESAEDATESPRSAVVGAVTFPFRLVGRLVNALFG